MPSLRTYCCIAIFPQRKYGSYNIKQPFPFREKALTPKQKKQPDPERYTIFHALFEAMKDKDKKHKK